MDNGCVSNLNQSGAASVVRGPDRRGKVREWGEGIFRSVTADVASALTHSHHFLQPEHCMTVHCVPLCLLYEQYKLCAVNRYNFLYMHLYTNIYANVC
jgi:hypothetical protein